MDMKITLGNNRQVAAHYKGYTITTDQPVKEGGDGQFPAPFDFFLASIGTCAGYYVQAFCQQRDLSTEGISLVQTMHKDEQNRMIGRIEIEILLPESFPEKYRASLIKAAEACAVKKHIAAGLAFSVHAITR
jgi:putative redox protein